MVILICVLLIAVIVDITSYKIPNMCIVVGILTGFIRAFSFGGMKVVLGAAGLVLIVFAIGYPLWLLRGIGAGDVKLLMVIACYLPKDELKICAVTTMLLAGAIALLKLLIYRESRERLKYFFCYLRKLIWCQSADTYEINRQNKHCVIRLSIPMLCSVLLQMGGLL